jgi:hypothetical protein
METHHCATDPGKVIQYYFVDEAGDFALFNRRGQILLGTPGVSSCIMIGVAWLPNPDLAGAKLEELRAALRADPYFKGVPSMQPSARKTALMFHAKDDVAEVRREVFKLLPSLDCKVQVAIRRKDVLVREAIAFCRYRQQKISAGEIYESLVKRLFRNLLHKADENHIIFSHRGKAFRKQALEGAIAQAKRNFSRRQRAILDKPTRIHSGYPHEHAGLQIVDYYLWALQRLYESGEDRFFKLLERGYRLVMDLDDTREKPYGRWFCDRDPLTLEKIKKPSNRLDPKGLAS